MFANVIATYIHQIQFIFTLLRLEISKFDTLSFLIFILVSIILYHIFRRNKLILLLICFAFYASFSLNMTKMIISLTLINYLLGIMLSLFKKRPLIILCALINLSVLFYFKYLNFFLININQFKIFGNYELINYVVIPLGISFFTFEFLHYLIDVYRGNKPVYNILNFFIFIFFFPTLMAGPIKRYEQFIPQLKKNKIDWDLMYDGLFLLIKGLFKKIVLANTLSIFSIKAFDNPETAAITLLGVYAFTFQIYFDFSGYTDIGRGIAALLNIKIPINFLQPYLSESIREFWRRWHISLMNWIRDYIYIPLGGSRVKKTLWIINTLIVFIISGIWHGAAWHFIVWGFYNALLIIAETTIKQLPLLNKLPKKMLQIISILTTFHLVVFGWILFRANDLASAFEIIKKIFTINSFYIPPSDKLNFLLIIMLLYSLFGLIMNTLSRKHKLYLPIRTIIYSLIIPLIVLYLNETKTPFIYFSF